MVCPRAPPASAVPPNCIYYVVPNCRRFSQHDLRPSIVAYNMCSSALLCDSCVCPLNALPGQSQWGVKLDQLAQQSQQTIDCA